KAETTLQGGNVAVAAQLFGQAAMIKDFAAADQALYRQAFCLAKLDEFAAAAAAYGKLADDFPKSSHAAEAILSAGRCYYRAEKWSDAKNWLQRALDLKDNASVEAAHWLCRLLIKTGQPAEAAAPAAG